MSNEELTLDSEAAQTIRHALIVGLSCYGEIERLCKTARAMKEHGCQVPDSFVPKHPTGSDDVIEAFADALAYLNMQ